MKLLLNFKDISEKLPIIFAETSYLSDGGYERGYAAGYEDGEAVGKLHIENLKNFIERNGGETVLPSDLTRIGDQVFINYSTMVLESLPDSITYIGTSAFQSCGKVTLNKLPDSLITLGQSAFFNCGGVTFTHIPEGVVSIGSKALSRCHALKSITFKGTPTTIASDAFDNCNNLLDVYVPWGEGEVANSPWGAIKATIHYNSKSEQ